MYKKPFDRALDEGPLCEWFFINKNVQMAWVYKTPEGRILIQDNIRHFDNVIEWKASVSKVVNDVFIEGLMFKGPDIEELKEKCLGELSFLNKIQIPYRDREL